MTINWRERLQPDAEDNPVPHAVWGTDYPEPYDPGPTDEDTITPTWNRLDLASILDGTHEPDLPTLMPRSDGPALLYPGRVHSLHGESESGKSMAIQAEAGRLIHLAQPVLYIDFESDATTVVGRLLEMGIPPALVAEHLDYRRPEINPANATHELRAFYAMLEHTYTLAVIDGVTEALHVFGTATKDNDELTGWIRNVPKRIARHTGAATVLIDHVTKDADTRGRFAIGGQAKMAALDGAAYVVEVSEPLGRGLRGVIILRVAKDRPGSVRPHAGTFRKTDRTQEAARVIVDSRTPGRIAVTVEPPVTALEGPDGSPAPFRPTTLMEKLSYALEAHTEPVSTNKLDQAVAGKRTAKLEAIDVLVSEGYVERTTGPRGAQMLRTIRTYRQVQDELSDRFNGHSTPVPDRFPTDSRTSESDPARPVPTPPPYRGGTGGTGHTADDEPTDLFPVNGHPTLDPDKLYGPPCTHCQGRTIHDPKCPNHPTAGSQPW